MKKYSMETTVGLFVVLGLICVGYMTVKLGNVTIFGDDRYTLYAKFTSISGLKVDNPVDMFGMEIGRIEGFKIDQEKQVAMVELKIDKDIKIYNDAIASIKTSGLMGDSYISIDPGGGSNLLKPGETILETQPPMDIMSLISKYAFGSVSKE
jgi:phospholipid/cholesterol/gamma-HCH transport system substrate-binding protein